ncbi:hypothetical protein H4R35_004241 [Dimargaris xerosporica]|nr:hypothetical protein H4R35_004241 [Dimargaris xerosporica]
MTDPAWPPPPPESPPPPPPAAAATNGLSLAVDTGMATNGPSAAHNMEALPSSAEEGALDPEHDSPAAMVVDSSSPAKAPTPDSECEPGEWAEEPEPSVQQQRARSRSRTRSRERRASRSDYDRDRDYDRYHERDRDRERSHYHHDRHRDRGRERDRDRDRERRPEYSRTSRDRDRDRDYIGGSSYVTPSDRSRPRGDRSRERDRHRDRSRERNGKDDSHGRPLTVNTSGMLSSGRSPRTPYTAGPSSGRYHPASRRSRSPPDASLRSRPGSPYGDRAPASFRRGSGYYAYSSGNTTPLVDHHSPRGGDSRRTTPPPPPPPPPPGSSAVASAPSGGSGGTTPHPPYLSTSHHHRTPLPTPSLPAHPVRQRLEALMAPFDAEARRHEKERQRLQHDDFNLQEQIRRTEFDLDYATWEATKVSHQLELSTNQLDEIDHELADIAQHLPPMRLEL